jgi:mRNA-degrading endonuclease toxin of MazEF toxin-antitoxin module
MDQRFFRGSTLFRLPCVMSWRLGSRVDVVVSAKPIAARLACTFACPVFSNQVGLALELVVSPQQSSTET